MSEECKYQEKVLKKKEKKEEKVEEKKDEKEEKKMEIEEEAFDLVDKTRIETKTIPHEVTLHYGLSQENLT